MSYAQPTTAHRSTERNDSLATYERASAKRQDLIARAGKMGPKAIAQARSDKERELLAAIFVAIPEVLRLSDAHGRIDAEGGDDDLAHRRWCRARYRLEGLLRQLINPKHADAPTGSAMSVIHIDFGSGSPLPPSCPDVAPLRPPLTAVERAMKAVSQVDGFLRSRGETPPCDREARARVLEESAMRLATSEDKSLALIEMAGMYALSAKIMRAKE